MDKGETHSFDLSGTEHKSVILRVATHFGLMELTSAVVRRGTSVKLRDSMVHAFTFISN